MLLIWVPAMSRDLWGSTVLASWLRAILRMPRGLGVLPLAGFAAVAAGATTAAGAVVAAGAACGAGLPHAASNPLATSPPEASPKTRNTPRRLSRLLVSMDQRVRVLEQLCQWA